MNSAETSDLLVTILKIHKFTRIDMNIFALICMKLKDNKTGKIELTYDEIREKGDYRGKDKKGFLEDIKRINRKLMEINITKETPEGNFETFSIFKRFSINPSEQKVIIKVKKKWIYLLDEFVKDFSSIEVNEFILLKNRYSKSLYRQLHRYRGIGEHICSMDSFRKIMDIPDYYTTKNIMNKVIIPSIKELKDKKFFDKLEVESLHEEKVGRPVKAYKFVFAF